MKKNLNILKSLRIFTANKDPSPDVAVKMGTQQYGRVLVVTEYKDHANKVSQILVFRAYAAKMRTHTQLIFFCVWTRSASCVYTYIHVYLHDFRPAFSVHLHHELAKLFPGELLRLLEAMAGYHCWGRLDHDYPVNVLAITPSTLAGARRAPFLLAQNWHLELVGNPNHSSLTSEPKFNNM